VRKELPDKAKLKTIVALLCTLEDERVAYRTRFTVEVDKARGPLGRELIQLFFVYREQLAAASRFVVD
jgi:hypothetical protein